MKPESIQRSGGRDLGPGQRRATEVCGAAAVSGTLIAIKFGKETALVLPLSGLLALGSLWSLWPAKDPARSTSQAPGLPFLSVPT